MGRDERFDSMRNSFTKFGFFWFLQATSVFLLLLPIVYGFSMVEMSVGLWQVVAVVIFIVGITLESWADRQKFLFKQKHPGVLYTKGLYSKVRYPSYLGEILVWLGIWLFTFNYYSGWSWLSIVSPIWTFILLRYISGIPFVERSRKINYEDDPKYHKYVKSTPLLIPRISLI